MKHITKPGLLMAAAFAVLPVGCGGGGSSSGGGGGNANPGGASASATVAVTNSASAPMGFAFASPVSVKSGGSVSWQNQSSAPHAIVWDAQTPSASPAPGAGIGVFSAGSTSSPWAVPVVTTATTYNYHCGIHGPTMAGRIIVTP